jgi:ribosomal protein L37E
MSSLQPQRIENNPTQDPEDEVCYHCGEDDSEKIRAHVWRPLSDLTPEEKGKARNGSIDVHCRPCGIDRRKYVETLPRAIFQEKQAKREADDE